MNEFTKRRVLVTGASGALGSAVAEAFAAAGASLALVARSGAGLAKRHGHRQAQLLAADLTDPVQAEEVVQEMVAEQGGIDVLANVAGGFAMGRRVHEMELEEWDHMLDLNAKSVLLMSRAALPHMLRQGRGRIVNVAARVADAGKARMASYSAAKSAVVRLTESLAAEYRADGINVNCVIPGTLDTTANRLDMPDADHSQWVAPVAVAEVIRFLASDAARAVHGACIPVLGLT